ncbi:MAG TPA: DUF433 domain-containing protein [Cyclobacteriaceae bacterium]|nr:DUF433 domain-containing protein [Cyclobacteriaceae bacterium]HRW98288.1 DUF433 domain-containing protein [Cyclobacteriaceae bacterium]
MIDWKNYLTSDPSVLFGKQVVKGTRIPVDLILEKLATNYSFEDLLSAYPKLSPDAIRACLAFASENAKHERIFAL